MENYCEECGKSLKGSIYTAPWEDDDNEYGYYTCKHCGHENTDWDSGDD